MLLRNSPNVKNNNLQLENKGVANKKVLKVSFRQGHVILLNFEGHLS